MSEARISLLAGMPTLFVMAAMPEYGPQLRKRIQPAIVGVGPVEAALETGLPLRLAQEAGTMPGLVVCLGSAGSRILPQGEIYQASSVSWRDMDASPLGFDKGQTPFTDHLVETPLETPLPGVPSARLSTGSDVVTGSRYLAIDADMVDMESFAVMRACQRFGVPMVALRGISDGAADLRRYEDWTHLLDALDERLAIAVDTLAVVLAGGWRPAPIAADAGGV